MVKTNVLKNYHLWSDIQLLTEETECKILKDNLNENNEIYDSLTGNYVEPPLLYCHIVDLEVLEDTDEFQIVKVQKIKGIGY